MMMLLVLTSVLGYELKTAVGTSVFIMTFTAFTGAVSHVAIGGGLDVFALTVCVVVTLLEPELPPSLLTGLPPRPLTGSPAWCSPSWAQ